MSEPERPSTIALHTLVLELIPRLKSTERLLRGTLSSSLSRSRTEEAQQRRQEQLAELDLTVKTFRLNVEPLLNQYPEALTEILKDPNCTSSPLLELDTLQAEALANAQDLCTRVQQLYGGSEKPEKSTSRARAFRR